MEKVFVSLYNWIVTPIFTLVMMIRPRFLRVALLIISAPFQLIWYVVVFPVNVIILFCLMMYVAWRGF